MILILGGVNLFSTEMAEKHGGFIKEFKATDTDIIENIIGLTTSITKYHNTFWLLFFQ